MHDFDTHDGIDFLVMGHVAGTSLAQRLASGLCFEEPNLKTQFGASYQNYLAVVQRWIPGRLLAKT